MAVQIGNHKLYTTQEPVEFVIGSEINLFQHDSINIREITNRVKVRVEGFEKPLDNKIELFANNGSYRVSGKLMKDKQLQYPSKMQEVPNANDDKKKDLYAEFQTLKFQTGYNNELVITDLTKQKEVLRCDLIGAILLSPFATNINLNCENDFDVLVKVKHCDCPEGTYMPVSIYVNKWLIHSYEVELTD